LITDLQFEPQPADGVTYVEKITPADRELDLSQPAHELVNRIRALSPHIGARAVVDGRPLIVWKAHVGEDGSLELLEVQPEGGRRMSYAEYLRGLR
jgi:methionyl-tRNA formyltransferase